MAAPENVISALSPEEREEIERGLTGGGRVLCGVFAGHAARVTVEVRLAAGTTQDVAEAVRGAVEKATFLIVSALEAGG